MSSAEGRRRTRPGHPTPASVHHALKAPGLSEAYAARRPYERNDTLGWKGRAARPSTRQRRWEQMPDEVTHGKIRMRMIWRFPVREAPRSAKGCEAKKRPNR